MRRYCRQPARGFGVAEIQRLWIAPEVICVQVHQGVQRRPLCRRGDSGVNGEVIHETGRPGGNGDSYIVHE